MKIEFSDKEYRYENDRAPKGYGRWGFAFEDKYEFWATGTLTEAKKSCREYIKTVAPKGYEGTVEVNILP